MRTLIAVVIVSSLLTFNVFASEKVYIDNEDIQEYKGKLGKWVLISSKSVLMSLSKRFYTKISEINARELGIKAFVLKPLVKTDFAMTVRKVLDER